MTDTDKQTISTQNKVIMVLVSMVLALVSITYASLTNQIDEFKSRIACVERDVRDLAWFTGFKAGPASP